jgi:uncharacterized protein YigE (DUF2233 family)
VKPIVTAILIAFTALAQGQSEYTLWMDEVLKRPPTKRSIDIIGGRATYKEWTLGKRERSRGGLVLCWLSVPGSFAKVTISETGKLQPETIWDRATRSSDIAVVNGGFWVTGTHSECVPLGLLIVAGDQRSRLVNWKGKGGRPAGGVLEVRDGKVSIKALEFFSHQIRFDFALQSRPILVESGKLAMRGDDGTLWNRTAIGVSFNGDVIIGGAFRDNAEAVSLYEFGYFLAKAPVDSDGGHMRDAINLDGAYNAQFQIPRLKLRYGASKPVCIPSVVRVGTTE